MPFLDRADAGRRLAGALTGVRDTDAIVLGLPRGGIPVGYQIARALGCPLDVILVRKVGLPAQPELAMGAIGEDGVRLINTEVVQAEQVSEQEFAEVEQRERAELRRRAERYRLDRPRAVVAGRTAIVVDDGIATGSTARAACQVARAHGAARVMLAVPVAPQRHRRRAEPGGRPGGLPGVAGAVLRHRPVVPGLLADQRRRGGPAAAGGRGRGPRAGAPADRTCGCPPGRSPCPAG